MKKYYIAFMLIISGFLVGMPLSIWGAPLPVGEVIFSEVYPGGTSSASEEYIKLYNATAAPQALDGWQLQYAPATATDWAKPSRVITLKGTVAAHDTFLLATSLFTAASPQQVFSGTLAQAGGHLRLVKLVNGIITFEDSIGWGSAAMPLTAAVSSPMPGNPITRRLDTSGKYMTSGNNAADYTSTESSATKDIAGNTTALPTGSLHISELLPNPGPPATDASDEYVELYNSSSSEVALEGLKLVAGSKGTYSFAFKQVTIQAGQYKAFYSRDTKLTLGNSGGKVMLTSSDGLVLDETDTYSSAANDQAWTYLSDHWQWSSLPTPGKANALPAITTAAAATGSKKSATKTAKAATTKPKSTKTKVKAATKKQTPNSTIASSSFKPEEAKSAPLHPLVLAVVGAAAVLYACYEYRHDLADRFRRFRTNRALRRTTRT